MKTIGMFEELQPNGMVAVSLNRVMCLVAVLAAITLTIIAYSTQTATQAQLMTLLEKKVVKPADIAILGDLAAPGEWMLGIIFTLLAFAFGFKAFTKTRELDALSDQTPVITDEKVENVEEKNHGPFGKPA